MRDDSPKRDCYRDRDATIGEIARTRRAGETQEITETKPIDETRIGEKRDEGGVRFFIQVRFFIRRHERRRQAGRTRALLIIIDHHLVDRRMVGGRNASE